MYVLKLTAEEILDMKKFGDLFDYNEDESALKKQYFALVKKFHPDLNRDNADIAAKVTAKVTAFYNEAVKCLIDKSEWEFSNKKIIETYRRKTMLLFLDSYEYELGKLYWK